MANINLKNEQWQKIISFLQTEKHIYICNEQECIRFLKALVWLARSGAQWRLLPKAYGNWNAVYRRFARWEEQGVFDRMMAFFASHPDLKNLLLDSTIVRAHSCAAGALKKTAVKTNKRLDVLEGVLARRSISWLMPQDVPSNCS